MAVFVLPDLSFLQFAMLTALIIVTLVVLLLYYMLLPSLSAGAIQLYVCEVKYDTRVNTIQA